MRLGKDQVAEFQRHGYLPVPKLLPVRVMRDLIDDFETVVDEVAAELLADGKLEKSHAYEPFEKRIASLSNDTGTSLQSRVSFPVNLRQAVFDFLHTPSLLDVIESLVGPEVYCNPTQHVRPKLPDGMAVSDWSGGSPIHQDAALLLPEADNTLVVTSWIPLVDASEWNGTLSVMPGLHNGPILTHERCPYGWTIKEDEIPAVDMDTVPMERGGVILLHGRTPHGSGPNLTDTVRWSLDLRWHDARMPGGRPLPGLMVRSQKAALTTYDEWIAAWDRVKADPSPRKMYRWS